MCGRYVLKSPPAEVAAFFGLDLRENFPPRYNIAPTQPIACVLAERSARAFRLLRWGFIPGWARGDYLERLAKRPLINARSETAAEKATFKSAIRRRRCLIPADAFYEWRGERGAKQPFAITRDGLFAFAGVWETAVGPDGEEIDTGAILTVPAGPDLADYHHREPVVIEPEDFNLWLFTDETEIDALNRLLHASPEGRWTTTPVSKKVNAVGQDGPELLQPLS